MGICVWWGTQTCAQQETSFWCHTMLAPIRSHTTGRKCMYTSFRFHTSTRYNVKMILDYDVHTGWTQRKTDMMKHTIYFKRRWQKKKSTTLTFFCLTKYIEWSPVRPGAPVIQSGNVVVECKFYYNALSDNNIESHNMCDPVNKISRVCLLVCVVTMH